MKFAALIHTDTCWSTDTNRWKQTKSFRFKIFAGLILPKRCCHSNDTHFLPKKNRQAPFEPNEGVGHEWMEGRNKWIHEWGIKETCGVYTVSESGRRHKSTNMCRSLCDYMPRTVLKGEEGVYSHCEQLVVNYQAFLYKKKKRREPIVELFHLISSIFYSRISKKRSTMVEFSGNTEEVQATGTCWRNCSEPQWFID